ncbi:MAG: hypothetical protein AAGG50_03050 [Bacteroidota bacterium]
MRKGQRLTDEQLRKEAQRLIDAYPDSQAALAREMGVDRSVVSHALNHDGAQGVYARIKVIEHLSSYTVEKETVYRVERKGSGA